MSFTPIKKKDDFATAIVQAMKKYGIRGVDIISHSGLPKQTVYDFLNGKHMLPPDKLFLVLDALSTLSSNQFCIGFLEGAGMNADDGYGLGFNFGAHFREWAQERGMDATGLSSYFSSVWDFAISPERIEEIFNGAKPDRIEADYIGGLGIEAPDGQILYNDYLMEIWHGGYPPIVVRDIPNGSSI